MATKYFIAPNWGIFSMDGLLVPLEVFDDQQASNDLTSLFNTDFFFGFSGLKTVLFKYRTYIRHPGLRNQLLWHSKWPRSALL